MSDLDLIDASVRRAKRYAVISIALAVFAITLAVVDIAVKLSKC